MVDKKNLINVTKAKKLITTIFVDPDYEENTL